MRVVDTKGLTQLYYLRIKGIHCQKRKRTQYTRLTLQLRNIFDFVEHILFFLYYN